jgi:hypothetical protein
MKKLPLLALVAFGLPQVARADEPKDLEATVTTAHVLPSIRSAEALLRKLSPTTSEIKLEAMANVMFGLDRALAEAFEGPVDFALSKASGSGEAGMAISLPWKDPAKLRGIGFEGTDGVRRVPIDATPVLPQLASAANATNAACALHPSPAVPGYRLVCASTPQALSKLGPYLANEVAREERPSDIAVRIPGSAIADAVGSGGSTEAERLAMEEVGALGRDLASGSLGLAWDAEAVTLAFDFRFGGRGAASSQMFLSASEHGRTLPAFFERLPPDAFMFGTLGGFDPALSRNAAQKAIELAANEAGAGAQLGVAVVRPLVDAVASKGFAFSFAAGIDAKRALAAVEAHKRHPGGAALEQAQRAVAPWFALEADGLADAAALVESVMKLSDAFTPFELAKGTRWPAGTKAWKLQDGGVLAAMPHADAMVVLYGADGTLVSEKLKAFAGAPGTRLKLAQSTRDAFRERPAAVLVLTDRIGDVAWRSLDEDSLDETLKGLREDAKRKGDAAQVPMTMSVRAASEANGWQGSLRLDLRYPVKALQAVSKGAKRLTTGGMSL